jgi:hypothetical protein
LFLNLGTNNTATPCCRQKNLLSVEFQKPELAWASRQNRLIRLL